MALCLPAIQSYCSVFVWVVFSFSSSSACAFFPNNIRPHFCSNAIKNTLANVHRSVWSVFKRNARHFANVVVFCPLMAGLVRLRVAVDGLEACKHTHTEQMDERRWRSRRGRRAGDERAYTNGYGKTDRLTFSYIQHHRDYIDRSTPMLLCRLSDRTQYR